MVTLYRQHSWRIEVLGREHGEPHFHIRGPGWRCSVSIERLELIVGEPPRQALRSALDWASDRQAQLMETWIMLNS